MLGLMSFASCSDMIKSDNDSMVINPALDTKSDSVFYALGIAQAMQQMADQVFFVGEMRGELVKPTINASTALQQLSNYSADASNAYDSAYVYYNVINNCNYYLKYRNTELYTGSINVSIEEYAAVAAIRAWAYLQLSRTYGGEEVGVPFFTEPLTAISQIDESNFPKYTLSQIVEALAPQLEQYSGMSVPSFGAAVGKGFGVGTPNWSSSEKVVSPHSMFIPVDVVLGEMYLESARSQQDFMKAAQHYSKYLANNHLSPENSASIIRNMDQSLFQLEETYEDFSRDFNTQENSYNALVNTSSGINFVFYIPMAVNSQNGLTSSIPAAFGYDYYSIEKSSTCPRMEKVQIVPSGAYHALTDSCDFYYYPKSTLGNSYPDTVSVMRIGDGRANFQISSRENNHAILNIDQNDTTKVYIAKTAGTNANVLLLRRNTVYLHLAEALNRAGHPDLAFAILRNGISDYLKKLIPLQEYTIDPNTQQLIPLPIPEYKYVSQESYDLLQTSLYFLNAENYQFFKKGSIAGIHAAGAGFINLSGKEHGSSEGIEGSCLSAVGSELNSYYLPKPVVKEKLNEIATKFGVSGSVDNEQDFINAMELVLCDEYAKELAFEGVRFYDLQRMARHLNEAGAFGGNFGSKWFANKLAGNNPVKNLNDPKNWYLPFK